MATAMLNAVEAIGRLPDCYFQAIGSGAGAIAAHEAAKRLVDDARFGATVPRLMLSQNAPFTPIHDAWKKGRRDIAELDIDQARTLTGHIVATVLSNSRPPYATRGGVFDVLSESQGDMFAIANDEAEQAMRLFEKSEGIDIDPAAGVALASLIRSARSAQIPRDATVLLHITGGGARRRALDKNLCVASPNVEISLAELATGAAPEKARRLFTDQHISAYAAGV
jgi:cysteate synthase